MPLDQGSLNMDMPYGRLHFSGAKVQAKVFPSALMSYQDTNLRDTTVLARIISVSYVDTGNCYVSLTMFKLGNTKKTGTYYGGNSLVLATGIYETHADNSIADWRNGHNYTNNTVPYLSALTVTADSGGRLYGTFILKMWQEGHYDSLYTISGDFDACEL